MLVLSKSITIKFNIITCTGKTLAIQSETEDKSDTQCLLDEGI